MAVNSREAELASLLWGVAITLGVVLVVLLAAKLHLHSAGIGRYVVLCEAVQQGVLDIHVDAITGERTYTWKPPAEKQR